MQSTITRVFVGGSNSSELELVHVRTVLTKYGSHRTIVPAPVPCKHGVPKVPLGMRKSKHA